KSTQTQRNYSSEAVIIGLVRRNMGIYAEPNRVISFIQTQNSQGRLGIIGKKITWSTRYKRLSDECIEVAKAAELGWWFYPDLAAGKWRIGLSEGNDRTRTSTTPIVFTEDFENLGSFEYNEDYSEYANVAVVGGEGSGAARTIVETSPNGGVTFAVDAARFEVFIDARDLQTEEGDDVAITNEELKTRGQTKLLSEFNTKETFEGQVLQTENYEFGVQYDLGDIVTIESKRLGLGSDQRITSVTETFESSGYVLELVFGDEESTTAQKIRRFKGALEGVKNS
uniref:siphovirus ReqiPepy6 Gp37-like family protein n=1 Tax=Staphylococcus aureus TaxID=1280 RepID=UPI0020C1044C